MKIKKCCDRCYYFIEKDHWIATGDEFDPTPINRFDGLCFIDRKSCDKGCYCTNFIDREVIRQWRD